MTKPMLTKMRRMGQLISCMESEFELISTPPSMQVSISEIKDMYDMIGKEFTDEEQESWEFNTESGKSGRVFTLIFEREGGHAVIKAMNIPEQYPAIYVKV